MPYKLRKAPKKDLYWVVSEDGTKHSKEPLPKKRAEAQRRALYIAMKKKGELKGKGSNEDKIVKEAMVFLNALRGGGNKRELVGGFVGGEYDSGTIAHEVMDTDSYTWNKVIPGVITATQWLAWIILIFGEEFPFSAIVSKFLYAIANIEQNYVNLAVAIDQIKKKSIEINRLLKTGNKEDKESAIVLLASLPGNLITVVNVAIKMYSSSTWEKVVGEGDVNLLKNIYNQVRAKLRDYVGTKLPTFEAMLTAIGKDIVQRPQDDPQTKATTETYAEWDRLWKAENEQYAKEDNVQEPIRVDYHIISGYTLGIFPNTGTASFIVNRYSYPANSLHQGYWYGFNANNPSPCFDFETLGWKDYDRPDGRIVSQFGTGMDNTFKSKWITQRINKRAPIIEEEDFYKGEKYIAPSVMERVELDAGLWKKYCEGAPLSVQIQPAKNPDAHLNPNPLSLLPEGYVIQVPKTDAEWAEWKQAWGEAWGSRKDAFNDAVEMCSVWYECIRLNQGFLGVSAEHPQWYYTESDRAKELQASMGADWGAFKAEHQKAWDGLTMYEAPQVNFNILNDRADTNLGAINFGEVAVNSPYSGWNGPIYTFNDTPEATLTLMLFYLYPRAMAKREAYKQSTTAKNAEDPSGKIEAPINYDPVKMKADFGTMRLPPIPPYAPQNPGNALWVRATEDAIEEWLSIYNNPDVSKPLVSPDLAISTIRTARYRLYRDYILALKNSDQEQMDKYGIADLKSNADELNLEVPPPLRVGGGRGKGFRTVPELKGGDVEAFLPGTGAFTEATLTLFAGSANNWAKCQPYIDSSNPLDGILWESGSQRMDKLIAQKAPKTFNNTKDADEPTRDEYIDMCSASYKKGDAVPKKIGGKWELEFTSETIKVYRATVNGKIIDVIAVRGSSTWEDWETNLGLIPLNAIPSGDRYKKDKGFLKAYYDEEASGKFPKANRTFGTGHSLGGALLDRYIDEGIVERGMSINPAFEPRSTNKSVPNFRIYNRRDALFNLLGWMLVVLNPNCPIVVGSTSGWDYIPFLGLILGHTDKEALKGNGKSGVSAETLAPPNPKSAFKSQLEELGINPSAYLKEAQRRAKAHKYPYKLLGFSTDTVHKLAIPDHSGKMIRFGRVGYGDHLIYEHLEKHGKVPRGTASSKQNTFQKSHSKMKGAWRENQFSPNNLALRILW